jgi:hypothetical protein
MEPIRWLKMTRSMRRGRVLTPLAWCCMGLCATLMVIWFATL